MSVSTGSRHDLQCAPMVDRPVESSANTNLRGGDMTMIGGSGKNRLSRTDPFSSETDLVRNRSCQNHLPFTPCCHFLAMHVMLTTSDRVY